MPEHELMLSFDPWGNQKGDKWGWRLVNYQPAGNRTLACSVGESYRTQEECIEASRRIKEKIPSAEIDGRRV